MNARKTSRDGLCEGEEKFVNSYEKAVNDYDARKKILIEDAKRLGCKAMRPDDGWVNREMCIFYLEAYPDYNLGVRIGDRVALRRGDDGYRIVTITGILRKTFTGNWYKFEDFIGDYETLAGV